MTSFHSASICGEDYASSTGLGTVTASGVSFPSHPNIAWPTQLLFHSFLKLHAVSPFIYIFPWTKNLGKFLPQWPHPSLSRGAGHHRENLFFFFPFTLDVKILHLILYIGDLRPTIVGNDYQRQPSFPQKLWGFQEGLRAAQNLGEGTQPAFLAWLPSCQHF